MTQPGTEKNFDRNSTANRRGLQRTDNLRQDAEFTTPNSRLDLNLPPLVDKPMDTKSLNNPDPIQGRSNDPMTLMPNEVEREMQNH